MYEYKIKKIKKIYDGDTMTVIIDLGFGVYKTEILRLIGIDAPELRGEEREDGLIVRDWLRNRLYKAVAEGKEIIIRTTQDKKGKYGRYLAEIFIGDTSINMEMLNEGLVEKYEK